MSTLKTKRILARPPKSPIYNGKKFYGSQIKDFWDLRCATRSTGSPTEKQVSSNRGSSLRYDRAAGFRIGPGRTRRSAPTSLPQLNTITQTGFQGAVVSFTRPEGGDLFEFNDLSDIMQA